MPLLTAMADPAELLHKMVPALSSVRLNTTPLGFDIVIVAPDGMIVWPLPLMLPPVQFIAPRTVTLAGPPSVPLLRFRIFGVTGPVPLKFTVAPEIESVLLVQI